VYDDGIEIPLAEGDHETGKWTDAIWEKSEGPTFQETHCAVEALWTEFIVSKGAQQFTNNDVRRFRKYKGPHVAKQNADLLPPFGSLSLLQTKRGRVTGTLD
jgi:hypothetical protein